MTATAPLVYTPLFENIRSLGAILAPDGLEWITELPTDAPQSSYILHLSCMAHYTPHIPYIAQQIFKRVGLDCPTLGGPESCCGKLHQHFGDPDLARHAAAAGIAGFRRARPSTVVSICPDCDESFTRFMPAKRPFDVVNISELLVQLLPKFKGQLAPIDARVVFHRHSHGEMRVKDMANIERLLRAVPGLEIVETVRSGGPGAHCNILAPMSPVNQAHMRQEALDLGADLIVVPYHSCYRQHCMLEIATTLKVQHYLGVLAISMGIPFEERYKELRLVDDLDKAVDRLLPEARARGIPVEALRTFVKTAVYCY